MTRFCMFCNFLMRSWIVEGFILSFLDAVFLPNINCPGWRKTEVSPLPVLIGTHFSLWVAFIRHQHHTCHKPIFAKTWLSILFRYNLTYPLSILILSLLIPPNFIAPSAQTKRSIGWWFGYNPALITIRPVFPFAPTPMISPWNPPFFEPLEYACRSNPDFITNLTHWLPG